MYFGLVKRVEEEEIEKEGLYKIYLIYSLSDCTRQELFNGKGGGINVVHVTGIGMVYTLLAMLLEGNKS